MANTKLLYVIVYEALKEMIVSGGYRVGDLLPSEREIGEQHNVDRTTVRKALKLLVDENLVVKLPGIGTKVISDEERRELQENKVEKEAIPITNSKGTIGFFLPPSVHRTDRINQPFYSTLFYHTEKEARVLGYTCFYSTLDEKDDFESLLNRQKFDGIIFVSNVSKKFINLALDLKIPCVLVNEYNSKILSYLVDNIRGMIDMCDYLIELGHKKFALIEGIESYLSNKERNIGCTYSFTSNNIATPYVRNCDWSPDMAYEVTKELLTNVDELPTAIIGFNDNIAIGCLRAANELGLRVPEDISIVGYDDIEQSRYTIPPLTTVHASILQLAQAALQGLEYQMQHEETIKTLKTYIPSSLKVRNSCSAPPTHKVSINR